MPTPSPLSLTPANTSCTTNTNSNLSGSALFGVLDSCFDVELASLSLLYKAEVGGGEEGPFAASYQTTFTNSSSDPENAFIRYVGGSWIGCVECYLVVKDGNHQPAQVLLRSLRLEWHSEPRPHRVLAQRVARSRTSRSGEPATGSRARHRCSCSAAVARSRSCDAVGRFAEQSRGTLAVPLTSSPLASCRSEATPQRIPDRESLRLTALLPCRARRLIAEAREGYWIRRITVEVTVTRPRTLPRAPLPMVLFALGMPSCE